MAAILGEEVGGRVGYRVRADKKIGPKTRIEVVTTGLFLRQAQDDAELKGLGAILFDEFHERTLEGDLALALAIDAQSALRPDLRLLVMSATLDGVAVARLLPQSRVLRASGKSFPVETRHLGEDASARLEDRVTSALRLALGECEGDVLVFLPGLAEIRRQAAALEHSGLDQGAMVRLLHGDLSLSEQDLAIRRDTAGKRKIILATSIAETSLTIDGVEAIVDCGLKRRAQFDPVGGMTRLVTTKVSLASANQRRGRAGRLGPGRCYRLWSAAAERGMAAYDAPEIEDCDLAPFALELALWGVADPGQLALLTQPPAPALGQARDLLRRLGAIDERLLAKPHGRKMAELGAHPRLAHMMIAAGERGLGGLACDIAALLSERDMVRERKGDCDLRHRLAALNETDSRAAGIDRGQMERIKRASRDWWRQLGKRAMAATSPEAAGAMLALAYPDRLAQRRGGAGQFRLANGRGAVIGPVDPLAGEAFLAIGSLDGDKRAARVFLAAPISLREIEAEFSADIAEVDVIEWNVRDECVIARKERRLWSLKLKEWPLAKPAKEQAIAAMIEGVRRMGLQSLPWDVESRSLQARLAFARSLEAGGGDWPDLSEATLLRDLELWLAPYLQGVMRRDQLQSIDLNGALASMLDWRQKRKLDEWAPTHWTAPTGSRIPLNYGAGEAPFLKVRLQEMFGAAQTPRVGDGKIEVVLHLLSPANRPVQVTRDLKGFWANSYFAVRSDLKGQYPRHYWPDDPLLAAPTRRAKPRGR
jgi:ATP-dependent helicase HrpB